MSTALATIPISSDAPTAMEAYTPRDLAGAFQLATHFAKSGLLGELNTPEKVLLVLATGAELGIPPTTALRSIHIIKGKPVCSADLLVSLCLRRKDRCARFVCVESTEDQATYETLPVGGVAIRNTFSLLDAKRAGLSFDANSNWSKYPRAMLRHRAGAELARMVYPDLVLGIYAEEEAAEIASDGVIDEAPIRIETPIAAAPVEKVDRAEAVIAAMMTAETLADLKAAAAAMAKSGATAEQKARGRDVYEAQKAALSQPRQPGEEG